MPSMAWSIGASSKMILAALPPSSRVSFGVRNCRCSWSDSASIRCSSTLGSASVLAISFPTSVEPVNAILSMSGCLTMAAPVSPEPVTIFTTPSGKSASWKIFANCNAVIEVVSAGLSTTVLPQASAGAIFQAAINNGKFQGMICPHTPTGSRSV